MTGLFVHKEVGENIALSMLRLYEDGHAIYKRSVGDKAYLVKELKCFAMKGLDVMGEPEYTFCGFCRVFDDEVTMKLENQVSDPTDTWMPKDLLTFTGIVEADHVLYLRMVSRRTQHVVERRFTPMTDDELIASL